MPQIGHIDVPDTLWEALVDIYAKDFTQIAFDIAKDKSDLDLTDPSYELGLEAFEATIPHMYRCVAALVRMHTGDFTSNNKAIVSSDDYNRILDTAKLQGHQIAYDALSSEKQGVAIKNILHSNWPEVTRLPPPS